MAEKVKALPGMEDILPGEIEKWQWLEEKARIYFGSLNFREIRTPILEYTDLFSRSVGESSDIVNKEMFSFEDRGNRDITLRPEMTASVARCVIEKGLLSQSKHLFLYYIGAMFRAERPQAGRKRQFHQIGIEIVNLQGMQVDVLCITALFGFLKWIGLTNMTFKINDLGDAETQKKVSLGMKQYFEERRDQLCKDCNYRLDKNVLRVFDCKNDSCQSIINQAPWDKIAPLSASFIELTKELDKYKVPFVINRRLVRGLDYYNGLVFEVSAHGLGAQDSLAGGGRYDRLYEQLGGKSTPSTGFSIGFERLLLAIQSGSIPYNENFIYIAPLTNNVNALEINNLIEEELKPKLNFLRFVTFKPPLMAPANLSDYLKAANKLGAGFVIIIGSEELETKTWTVKNMNTGEQKSVKHGDLFFYLKGIPPL